MGRIVIVAYRPKPGRAEELKTLVRSHVTKLQALGLATTREPLALEAIEEAHANPEVQALWDEFAAVCEYLPVGELAEAGQLFSEFEALN